MTNIGIHCFLPLQNLELLEAYVANWEAQNEPLRAIVEGVYKPSTMQMVNTYVMLDRVPETLQDPITQAVSELHGFCLVADHDQVTPEIWELIASLGVVFESSDEYLKFCSTLQ